MATTLTVVEKVFQRMGKGLSETELKMYRTSIEACLPEALTNLGEKVAMDPSPNKRSLLQTSFSFTLSSGSASLASSTTLLRKSIPVVGYVTMTSVTNQLQWLPFRRDLDNPPPLPDYYFYTIFNDTIIVRNHLAAVPSETALTLIANFIPTISQVDDELLDDLVAIIISMLSMQEPDAE